ncbi:putative beta-tubulin cofactor D, partial [Cardiosporidium cionae]
SIRNIPPKIEKFRMYRSKGGEWIRESCCRLIQCIVSRKSWNFQENTALRYLQTLKECLRNFSEDVQLAAAEALYALLQWRLSLKDSLSVCDMLLAALSVKDEHVAARRGYALAVGMLPVSILEFKFEDIVDLLCKEITRTIQSQEIHLKNAETRRNALVSLILLLEKIYFNDREDSVIQEHRWRSLFPRINWEIIMKTFCMATKDYEMDERGDVGLWVREVAAE